MGNSRSREIRLKNGKLFSVPAPAVKYLLRDLPHYKGNVNTELCTPTGAALIRYFADDFRNVTISDSEKCGYGFGSVIAAENDYVCVYK